jgi:3-oxoacyl-[acyl-carrier-protein] synthase II
MTSPAPNGEGGRKCMELALKNANLKPEDIGYINAHGTSTPTGDLLEAQAIASLFENAKQTLNVSSTKSMTGHLLGAAGAVEACFSILALRDQIIPPTINLENCDDEIKKTELNFTPIHAQKKNFNYALSNSFGFGGTNASLIFKKI